jgi:uncharacterized protein YkwD
MRSIAVARRTTRLTALSSCAAALVVSAACAATPAAPTAPGAIAGGTFAEELAYCTDEINRYRTLAGRPPLDRAADLDDFAARAAEHDHRIRVPHQYFRQTNGGGVSRAETQLLLWKGYPVREVIRRGLAGMWAEGPRGSHYQTLAGEYRQVGCGVFVNGTEVSVSQDFR